jgi:hypothetical protein
MFSLQYSNLSWDADLQVIHADVLLSVDGDVLIDEPLCIDVGLPALLYSVNQDVEPNRWAAPEEYDRMPFFCCGCGDPECRAYSFRVRHIGVSHVALTELEERHGAKPKVFGAYVVLRVEYKDEILQIAEQFLSFVEHLDYKPYYKHTIDIVRKLAYEAKTK